MNILVLGGAGHIGSNLISSLIEKNSHYNIYSLDDYSNGSKDNHHEGCFYITGNVSNIDEIICFDVDMVIHLAEFSRVEQSFPQFSHVIENNIIGTLRVIEFCLKNNCKLIYSASSAISSINEKGIVNAPYTLTKNANAELIKSIAEYKNLNYCIVYFYNVFGPGEKGIGPNATVVEKFMQLKLSGKTATITGLGSQKRNFTHVYDIVDGIIKVMMNGSGDGYYIGNPRSYSIIELANLMELPYTLGPDRLGNRTQSKLDLQKMQGLNWAPRYELSEYLRNRLNSYYQR